MKDARFERYDVLLIVGASILLGVLVYAFREVLSPPVASFLVLIFLLPLPGHRIKHSLIFVTVVLLVLWFVSSTATILMPFIISLVLAYLFDPVVDRLEKLRIPRTVGILIIVLVVVGLFALASIFLVPQIVRELKELIDLSIVYSNKFAEWVQRDGLALLQRFGFDTERIQEIAIKELPGRLKQVLEAFFKGALTLTSAVSTAFSQLLNLVLVPFIFFYLLKDIDRLKAWIKSLITSDQGWLSEKNIEKIDGVLSGYIRGQLIVCFIVAVLTSTGLTVFGVKYALILGIIAGVLNLVPYIGLLITLILGLIVGIFSESPLFTCIKIVIIIEAVQIIESAVLSPRIVGERVGLHPAWVIFAILVFAHFWGFIGLLIAVPLAATIRIFASAWLQDYRKRLPGVEEETM
ncbi:MAG: AI-2E family transporter [Candidatus Latescibacteria bacterium]|nr:AI-2E family transporter [Candidatus Latescibacterota bacterium]NIM21160.1 AI-2E family transporter [Candidatus Latescibacterota bacterium]NIM65295.1 AI-2E family transporter [Candidatus Latescibacterota bacterium]NIO01810.1 AI-2E family transporter [Candidatus Latescibacterota bacterium]NIO28327.1 AI-2E family transporter [Candidatus Latescibacterota bacterium]